MIIGANWMNIYPWQLHICRTHVRLVMNVENRSNLLRNREKNPHILTRVDQNVLTPKKFLIYLIYLIFSL